MMIIKRFKCPHGHIFEHHGDKSPSGLLIVDPDDIAYCANCEHKVNLECDDGSHWIYCNVFESADKIMIESLRPIIDMINAAYSLSNPNRAGVRRDEITQFIHALKDLLGRMTEYLTDSYEADRIKDDFWNAMKIIAAHADEIMKGRYND